MTPLCMISHMAGLSRDPLYIDASWSGILIMPILPKQFHNLCSSLLSLKLGSRKKTIKFRLAAYILQIRLLKAEQKAICIVNKDMQNE
jgi:hypothetical protein